MSNLTYWQFIEREVRSQITAFPGVAGLCIKDLTDGMGFSINGEEEFPAASTIKMHVLTRLLQRAERGEIDLKRVLTLKPENAVPGSGILTYLEGNVSLSLLNLMILMIIVSDNTATNLCIDLAGMEETNALIRQMGLDHTLLRRKMQDRAAIARNDENITTPADCVRMLEALYQGKPSPKVAEQCLGILKKNKKGLFNTAITGVPLANKPGGMEKVRCDAGIVYLTKRPYAMAVMTKFSIQDVIEQERYVVDLARGVHKAMVTLDGTSAYGLGIV